MNITPTRAEKRLAARRAACSRCSRCRRAPRPRSRSSPPPRGWPRSRGRWAATRCRSEPLARDPGSTLRGREPDAGGEAPRRRPARGRGPRSRDRLAPAAREPVAKPGDPAQRRRGGSPPRAPSTCWTCHRAGGPQHGRPAPGRQPALPQRPAARRGGVAGASPGGSRELDPAERHDVRAARLRTFSAAWRPADARWKAVLAPLRGRPMFTRHHTMTLLPRLDRAARRGLARAEAGRAAAAVPPRRPRRQIVKAQGVKAILVENYYDTRSAEVVARHSGAKVVLIPGDVAASPGRDTLREVSRRRWCGSSPERCDDGDAARLALEDAAMGYGRRGAAADLTLAVRAGRLPRRRRPERRRQDDAPADAAGGAAAARGAAPSAAAAPRRLRAAARPRGRLLAAHRRRGGGDGPRTARSGRAVAPAARPGCGARGAGARRDRGARATCRSGRSRAGSGSARSSPRARLRAGAARARRADERDGPGGGARRDGRAARPAPRRRAGGGDGLAPAGGGGELRPPARFVDKDAAALPRRCRWRRCSRPTRSGRSTDGRVAVREEGGRRFVYPESGGGRGDELSLAGFPRRARDLAGARSSRRSSQARSAGSSASTWCCGGRCSSPPR